MPASDTAEMQELAGNTGDRSRMSVNAARSAEGRCVPLAKTKGTRMSAVKPRRRALLPDVPLGAPPPRLSEGSKNPPRKGGPTTASRGADFAADDFAWLYDK